MDTMPKDLEAMRCENCGYTFTVYETGIGMNDGRPEPQCPKCFSDRIAHA